MRDPEGYKLRSNRRHHEELAHHNFYVQRLSVISQRVIYTHQIAMQLFFRVFKTRETKNVKLRNTAMLDISFTRRNAFFRRGATSVHSDDVQE